MYILIEFNDNLDQKAYKNELISYNSCKYTKSKILYVANNTI